MLKKLNEIFSFRDKQIFVALILFSICISAIETLGVSAIMPFIAVATDFSLIHTEKYYAFVHQYLGVQSDVAFVVIFGCCLVGFYIFRSSVNILYFYALYRFTHLRYHLMAHRLFRRYIEMPYQEFTSKNSSVLTKSVVNEALNLTLVISSVLIILSEISVVLFIYCMLLYVNYKITLVLTLFLVLNVVLMTKTVSERIKSAGTAREEAQRQFYEIVNRSFGNFKIIKLQSSIKDILDDFSEASFRYSKANVVNATIGQVPRLFLEAMGFGIIIMIVVYFVWKGNTDVSNMLPIISMFVLSLYRLMPSVNRIVNAYNHILFYHRALDIVYTDLTLPKEVLGDGNIEFKKQIRIENLEFEYDNGFPVLVDANLTVNKGENIAFVGGSGSGKSTIVDLLIGLYKPKAGIIMSDDKRLDDGNIKTWRSKVGYIPQQIYLFDGTVGQNVAFGSVYDKERVDSCLKKARIFDYLQTKHGRETMVGEGGIMLSGGQKQRIGIARALYSEPEIIIFDEATSALDPETEKEIMNEIYTISSDKTLIIIAHRLSTIDRCDKIYKVEDKTVVRLK